MLALFSLLYIRSAPNEGALLPLIIPGVPALLLGLLAAIAGVGLGLRRFLGYAGLLGLGAHPPPPAGPLASETEGLPAVAPCRPRQGAKAGGDEGI